MSEIEVVKPIDHEGIELYVSADGKQSGMSVRGLSRFCGVPRTTLSALFDKLNKADETDYSGVPESLKAFIGKGFAWTLQGDAGGGLLANIVPADICEEVIHYYAYESNRVSESVKQLARKTHRSFAKRGLHNWICNVAGFVEDNNNNELLSLVKEVLTEVKELRQVATEYKVIRERTTTYLPGADDLLDELKNEKILTGETPYTSLEGWLFAKGVMLSEQQFRRLAHIVCDTYRSLTKEDPKKAHCKVNGKIKYNVSVFKPEHYPILQIGLNKLLA